MDARTSPPDAASSLLADDEPAPFELYNTAGQADVLLLCDHARNFIPRALDRLGLPAEAMERHIAYDIGILPVTRMLADALDAPAVLSHFSRLIVDPNRQLDDPTLVPEVSDGTIVPGNRGLTADDVEARLATFFWPYHHAVARQVEAMQARGRAPVVISMHSFTPVMRGRARPWEVGVLWDRDTRLPPPTMEALRRRGHTVGDNEPYSARGQHGYSQHVHADRLGLANVLIELRQDLIDTRRGQARWAAELAAVFGELLRDPDLYHAHPR